MSQGQIRSLLTILQNVVANIYINNYTQRITAAMKENLPYVVYSELRMLRRLAMMISLKKKEKKINIGSQSRIVVERGDGIPFRFKLTRTIRM